MKNLQVREMLDLLDSGNYDLFIQKVKDNPSGNN